MSQVVLNIESFQDSLVNNIAVISDIHLGHKKNSANSIIENLDKYLTNDRALMDLDVLFIAGDVFDTALYLSSDEVPDVQRWIAKLLYLCKRHDVIVRILEGTPSHDRGQSAQFEVIHHVLKIADEKEVNLKYINKLDIEYIHNRDLTVLYVPDEWGTTTQDTLDQVKSLMREKGLRNVDIAIMHGIFPHQLPKGLDKIPRHDDVAYQELVRGPIFVGHVHTHSRAGNIVAQGSFDRLAHNEEEDKGYVKATLYPDGTFEAKLIINENAKIYKTIKVTNPDISECLLEIDDIVKEFPVDSYVRISSSSKHPISANLGVLKARWPIFHWTHTSTQVDAVKTKLVIEPTKTYVPIVLNRENLLQVVMDRIDKLSIDPQTLVRCSEQLKACINGN